MRLSTIYHYALFALAAQLAPLEGSASNTPSAPPRSPSPGDSRGEGMEPVAMPRPTLRQNERLLSTRLTLSGRLAAYYDTNVELAPSEARFSFIPPGIGTGPIELTLDPDNQPQDSWVVSAGLNARYQLEQTHRQTQALFGQIVLRHLDALRATRSIVGGGYSLWRGLCQDSAFRVTGSFYYRDFGRDAVTMQLLSGAYRRRIAHGSVDMRASFAAHTFERYTPADGEKTSLTLGWNLSPSQALSCRLAAGACNYQARAATSTYRDLFAKAALKYQLSPQWSLFANIKLSRRDYDDVNPMLASERVETVKSGQIGLRQRLSSRDGPPWIITHSLRFLDIQSSNSAFERQRQVLGSELRLFF